MATATYPDGRVVDFDGSAALVQYYEAEGATIGAGGTGELSGYVEQVQFPRVYDGGDHYLGEEPEAEVSEETPQLEQLAPDEVPDGGTAAVVEPAGEGVDGSDAEQVEGQPVETVTESTPDTAPSSKRGR